MREAFFSIDQFHLILFKVYKETVIDIIKVLKWKHFLVKSAP